MPEIVHARYLQASAAARWGRCPASVALSKDLPDDSSSYAEEGTRAHRLCELLVRNYYGKHGLLAALSVEEEKEFLDTLDTCETEMRDAAFTYLRTIQAYVGSPEKCVEDGAQLAIEQRLDISWITGEDGAVGTADFIAIAGNTLRVFDFKYGRGVRVDAEKNEQLGMYGAAYMHALDPYDFLGIETVVLHIVQPRLENHSQWEQPASEFREGSRFITNARAKCARALELVNGAAIDDKDFGLCEVACRFCRAKAICPKQVAKVNEFFAPIEAEDGAAIEAVESKSIPVPTDPQKLAVAFSWLEIIEGWCASVREATLETLKKGEKVPGYKLVEGRAGPRKWADERAAEAALVGYLRKEEAYEKKLISPTAVEKLHKSGRVKDAKWEKLKGLITRSAPKPAIARADDPRPEYGAAIAANFEKLDN